MEESTREWVWGAYTRERMHAALTEYAIRYMGMSGRRRAVAREEEEYNSSRKGEHVRTVPHASHRRC